MSNNEIPAKVLSKRKSLFAQVIVFILVAAALSVVVGVNYGLAPALATMFWGVVFGFVYGGHLEWFSRFKAFKLEMGESTKAPEVIAREWNLI